MSIDNTTTRPSAADQKELFERGEALYARALQPILEPDKNGQHVAFHVDSGDYALGQTASKAIRAIRADHGADGRLHIRKIGPEPELILAARFFGPGPQSPRYMPITLPSEFPTTSNARI